MKHHTLLVVTSPLHTPKPPRVAQDRPPYGHLVIARSAGRAMDFQPRRTTSGQGKMCNVVIQAPVLSEDESLARGDYGTTKVVTQTSGRSMPIRSRPFDLEQRLRGKAGAGSLSLRDCSVSITSGAATSPPTHRTSKLPERSRGHVTASHARPHLTAHVLSRTGDQHTHV